MILASTDEIKGKRITEVLGLVKGNTVRARHIGQDFMAFLRNIVGGEVRNYTKLIAESREQAIDRMVAEAEALGANGVVGVRLITASIMQGSSELLAFGTAVKLADEK
ncbi:MAG TPA: hypothetical protein DEO84_09890 [candidate division Zixibacteria bacterium]|jgi:uncharacterized protein YbjQ (UPF0145 family)|nr:hypothetical protein [candidate division Zixibacteria bacterium]HBZ01616.1 hypothetical protein [candidate division Zixibacteria bacterium]